MIANKQRTSSSDDGENKMGFHIEGNEQNGDLTKPWQESFLNTEGITRQSLLDLDSKSFSQAEVQEVIGILEEDAPCSPAQIKRDADEISNQSRRTQLEPSAFTTSAYVRIYIPTNESGCNDLAKTAVKGIYTFCEGEATTNSPHLQNHSESHCELLKDLIQHPTNLLIACIIIHILDDLDQRLSATEFTSNPNNKLHINKLLQTFKESTIRNRDFVQKPCRPDSKDLVRFEVVSPLVMPNREASLKVSIFNSNWPEVRTTSFILSVDDGALMIEKEQAPQSQNEKNRAITTNQDSWSLLTEASSPNSSDYESEYEKFLFKDHMCSSTPTSDVRVQVLLTVNNVEPKQPMSMLCKRCKEPDTGLMDKLIGKENKEKLPLKKSIFSNFKDEHIEILMNLNGKINHRYEFRYNRLQIMSVFLIYLDRYSISLSETQELPLFKQFMKKLNPEVQKKDDSARALFSGNQLEAVKLYYQEILIKLKSVRFDEGEDNRNDLNSIRYQMIEFIKKLDKNAGKKPKDLPKPFIVDPEREQTDLNLLYAKAAFNQLILNSDPTKEWVARLKWFDKSGWLRGQLRPYLRKLKLRLDYPQSANVAELIAACKEMMDQLDIP
jgi:hypothetical protein